MADESQSQTPEGNPSAIDATAVAIDETEPDATRTEEAADDKTPAAVGKNKTGPTTGDNDSEIKKDGGSLTLSPQADVEREFSLFGRTSSNLRLFVAVLAVTILLRSIVQQYIVAVSRQLQRRYYIEENSLNFAFGVEKIAIVGTLLFIGYYGNASHKPFATFCGAILCAAGTLVCAIPYFISGPLEQEKDLEESLAYAAAGLCKAGYGADSVNKAQCARLPDSLVVNGSFSLLCTGQFLMGLGTALLATLGLMYVEEVADRQDTPLYYGDSGAAVWSPGAWWLALPLLSVGLLLPSPIFFLFPRWLREPRWLVRRRERRRRLEEKREARRQELLKAEKERRRRHRRRKKRELERRKRAAEAAQGNGEVSSAVDGIVTPSGQNGTSTSGGDTDVVSSSVDETLIVSSSSAELRSSPDNDQHNATDGPVAAESKTPGNDDDNSGEPDDVKSSDEEGEPATTTEREAAQSERTNTDEKPSTAKHNGVTSSVDEEQVDKQPRDTDGVDVEVSRTKDIGDGESATETKEADVSKADQRNRKRYALGRKLQDLPRNMLFLAKQPIFAITLCGTILWAYFPAGYHAVLPQYLHSQFQQSEQAAHTTAGVCVGLASSLGVVLSAVATHRWSLRVVRQMALALAAMTVCTVVLFILFAFGCDDVKQVIGTRSEESYFSPICTDSCSCAQSQYDPVCSVDHQMFPSPCLAGCNMVNATPTLNYSGCACVADGPAAVSANWCQTCGTLVPYVLFLFLTVTAHAFVPLPVLLVFLRKVPEKLRSLSLGLSTWLVYLIAYSPGYTAYFSIGEEACRLHKKSCYEDEHCWRHDNRRHRVMLHGITVALQVAAMFCFAGSWYRLRLSTKPTAASGAAKRIDTEQPEDMHLENGPTQTADKIQANGDNETRAEQNTTVQGESNLAFSDDQCQSHTSDTKV
ncbi:hypothetical protein NP493_243g02030 [Ridgeia piscesae]|uniref:Kazal-like domain-containing protein n=1 Tax=Ridgeia piscesae TaxID=27915 RepID=A0AAD9UDB2_RIDPI|nr:hypothetical protein NP493_243g02030 [Ridgeia piscesae]